MRKYGFTLPRYPERPICHAEFISASKDVRSRQQTLKPSPRTQPCKARKLANKQVPVQGDKGGFTLAEVLITLAIIGVVAALTIPAVVRNYQKTQTVTKLKKAYSALANTTNLAIANEGPIANWEVKQGAQGSIDFSNKYLVPYLKVSENCNNDTSSKCAFKRSYLNKNTANLNSSCARFFLNDGTLIGVQTINSTVNNIDYNYAWIYIDVNGQKKPNTIGKDIFLLRYNILYSSYTGKFLPPCHTCAREHLFESDSDACNKNQTGNYCSTVIMKDSWQIKDDYPW